MSECRPPGVFRRILGRTLLSAIESSRGARDARAESHQGGADHAHHGVKCDVFVVHRPVGHKPNHRCAEPRRGAEPPVPSEHDPGGDRGSEIAADLQVTESTVKTHLARAQQKLGLRDRVHVVIWA